MPQIGSWVNLINNYWIYILLVRGKTMRWWTYAYLEIDLTWPSHTRLCNYKRTIFIVRNWIFQITSVMCWLLWIIFYRWHNTITENMDTYYIYIFTSTNISTSTYISTFTYISDVIKLQSQISSKTPTLVGLSQLSIQVIKVACLKAS